MRNKRKQTLSEREEREETTNKKQTTKNKTTSKCLSNVFVFQFPSF